MIMGCRMGLGSWLLFPRSGCTLKSMAMDEDCIDQSYEKPINNYIIFHPCFLKISIRALTHCLRLETVRFLGLALAAFCEPYRLEKHQIRWLRSLQPSFALTAFSILRERSKGRNRDQTSI